MKKYEKPVILIEEFSLSQHVANCALDFVDMNGETTLTDANTCIAYTDGNLMGYVETVFTEANQSCSNKFEQYCYTGGAGGMNTFVS